MEWVAWKDSLQDLKIFKVPRAYTAKCLSSSKRKEIHVFSDASVQAIAAAAYIKLTDLDGQCHIGFVMAKAKLAPQAIHTIPRLELCAAVLAVEVAELVLRELDIPPDALIFNTDSKVVSGYICNETRRFYVYVSNRVQHIRRVSS